MNVHTYRYRYSEVLIAAWWALANNAASCVAYAQGDTLKAVLAAFLGIAPLLYYSFQRVQIVVDARNAEPPRVPKVALIKWSNVGMAVGVAYAFTIVGMAMGMFMFAK